MWAAITTIGGFLPGLFGKQVSEKVSRVLGTIALIVALAAILSLGKCAYDRSVVNDHEAKREAKAAPAREEAADQRLEDQTKNSNSEKELNDAIQSAPPGGTLSPAAVALSCERLRRVGRVPPACRSQGGN